MNVISKVLVACDDTTKNRMLKNAFEHAKKIGDKLNIKVVLEEDEIMFGGWVSMRPDTIEIEMKFILGNITKMVVGWVIEESHIIPATSWEPQDCDVVEVAQYEREFSAIQYCLNKVKENEVNQCLENYTESLIDWKTEAEMAEAVDHHEKGSNCG